MEKKILIAEDEMIIALNLKQVIQRDGYNVCHISKSGRDMIDSTLKIKPDLLIVDVYLDDEIDGIEAVNVIHQTDNIPVIYTSASTDPTTFEKAQKSMMADFLKKPYNNEAVLKSIHSVL